ncbi:hypothetical protein [Spiroplasma endosymbiont of Panorpa germanica]|uniref:hypothetical protein n=1 Tax=Spiroplasma endosymbiont of Panorpa germanica TaxID=3066314 RepID=UPI0030D5336B
MSTIFRGLSDEAKKQITSDKYSNRYEFESNNSNLYDTFANINELSTFSKVFDSEIKKDIIDELKQPGEFSFDTSNIEFESHEDWRRFISPNRDYGKIWNYSEWSLSVKDAFTKDNDAFEEAINQAEEFSKLTKPSQNLLNYLETDQESSQHLNSFILFDNYLTGVGLYGTLKLKVSSNNINLDTGFDYSDLEKLSHQRRTLGFIGTNIKNIKATYKPIGGQPIELELPEQFIVNRQLTTFSNTKGLFKQHVRANLLFDKEMLGFNKEESDIAPEDYGNIFELTKPKGFEGDFIPDVKYDFDEVFSMIFEETLEKTNAETKKEGWFASDYIKRFYFNPEPSYFKINDQGYLFLYTKNDTLINSGHWMLTSGTPLTEGGGPTTSHNQLVYFEIGEWSMRNNNVSGDGKRYWKFKMD